MKDIEVQAVDHSCLLVTVIRVHFHMFGGQRVKLGDIEGDHSGAATPLREDAENLRTPPLMSTLDHVDVFQESSPAVGGDCGEIAEDASAAAFLAAPESLYLQLVKQVIRPFREAVTYQVDFSGSLQALQVACLQAEHLMEQHPQVPFQHDGPSCPKRILQHELTQHQITLTSTQKHTKLCTKLKPVSPACLRIAGPSIQLIPP